MNDETVQTSETQVDTGSELEQLKDRATLMGIKFSSQIGAKALAKKIQKKLDGESDDEPEVQPVATPNVDLSRVVTPSAVVKRKEASRLVLCRITCMNPNKKEWEGEIISVGNSYIGTFKKYVRFNSEKGWYIPQIIFDVLKARKCQIFQTVTRNGQKVREGKLINEFAIEQLPLPTRDELTAMANKQTATLSVD